MKKGMLKKNIDKKKNNNYHQNHHSFLYVDFSRKMI